MTTLATLPPAVRATAPAPSMSPRYEFVSTAQIVDKFAEEGWELSRVMHAAPRSRPSQFTKHMLDFRHPELHEVHGAVPRIIFINSHDGSSSARVMAGLFRFVCSNGLVIGDNISTQTTRHIGDAAADLIHRMRTLARETTRTYAQVERWARKDLTKGQRHEFARFAAQLRWGDAQRFPVEDLLQLRRAEDDRGDLWSTFNRLQENTVLGGIEGLSRSGRAATSRPLSDITRSVEYNAQLWALATEIETTW